MKLKLLVSSMLMAGALMGSGSASADWAWSGSTADWVNSTDGGGISTIIDDGVTYPHPLNGTAMASGDGDTTFTYLNDSGFSVKPTITLTEEYASGIDVYNVGLAWLLAEHAGKFGYSMSSTDTINQIALDSIVSVNGDVSKYLFTSLVAYNNAWLGDYSGAINNLNSIDGAHVPAGGGFIGFTPSTPIYVLDVINGGNIKDIHNEFTVPEPMTLVMLGLGLLGFGYSRRHVLAKGMSA